MNRGENRTAVMQARLRTFQVLRRQEFDWNIDSLPTLVGE